MLPEIKNILYVTNLGPEASHVFGYAMSQAHQYKAQIHLLHIVEPLGPFAKNLVEHHLPKEKTNELWENTKKSVIQRIEKRLSKFCEQETCTLDEGSALVSSIEVMEGQPAEVIIDEARKKGADLIVMGSHRHKWLTSSGFLGSTARRVVNQSEIPVLTVYTPKDKLVELD